MTDYGRKSTFSSFLPGIAGIRGIPIWCYYVNRGQGVVSFGVDNKDHAIMEFYPAHLAYQNVKRTGFRTFLRKDGTYLEAFSDETLGQDMHIAMNGLAIHEENPAHGLVTDVAYYTMPEEHVGALVRMVTITNTSGETARVEVLDGMPALIPYGVGTDSMKNMLQTAKAWMQVEDADTGIPYYRVRASMDDSAAVKSIEGGNFSAAFDEEGNHLSVVVDPEAVFSYENSLEKPVRFMEQGLAGVLGETQNTSNLLPCSFFAAEKELAPGESICIYEIIGQVEKKELLSVFFAKKKESNYFLGKQKRAQELAEELCKGISTKTADGKFDAYCRYTYMDNVLRGGYPIRLGNNKIFYVYSRKHGDLERDYNYFSMLPEFYSQGNGNFRDVNQNRRCDTFFAPFVGRENIHSFYSLIQLDGYNPLGVEKLTYSLKESRAKSLLHDLPGESVRKILSLVTKAYTPGQLYGVLEECVPKERIEELFGSIIDFSDSLVNGNFGEGYWSDHWTYNLDLIEEYLSVFPEKEQDMLYEKSYTYFLSQVNINRRAKRYEITENGVRQYHALNEAGKRITEEKLLRGNYGKGEIIYSTLMEKLILLCTLKFAALDPYGMGVEMEGGKPGWYDALNGMPGMLGSSMAETYELARMLDYTIITLKKYPGNVELLAELGSLIEELGLINQMEEEHIGKEEELLAFWNKINDAKENYRDETYEGISGRRNSYSTAQLSRILEGFRKTVNCGITKALGYGKGICPTYFTYQVTRYEQDENGIYPLAFEVQTVPYFLEGPVRYLKLSESTETKKTLYDRVKNSELYDNKLSMYKVNAPLKDASYELGRARAFTPGWLENESIWLHMEYKYLLEILKSGLYEEFAEDFHKAVIPFLDEEVYGRSTLENSSFLASSSNPNPKLHGKGFVARLSGSTIEFISMWKRMMFGERPFREQSGRLLAVFAPVIPEYLIGSDRVVSAVFLGKTKVNYFLPDGRDFFPGTYHVEEMTLTSTDGSRTVVKGSELSGEYALDLREGKVTAVDVALAR
jgi:hypothetical protein